MKPLALIILLIFIIPFTSTACSCLNFFKWDKLSDFDQYEFIALVKIIDSDDHPENSTLIELEGRLKIKIIELFKGKAINTIIESDKNTSCDMGIQTGEEWILYGLRYKKDLYIQACDRNRTYKEADELIDWHYADGIDELNALRKLFNHTAPVFPDGEYSHTYSNGQLEYTENYSNGILNGERKIWYPNGTLYAQQYYVNGIQEGRSVWYYPSGQLDEEEYFQHGINNKNSKIYYDTTIAPYMKASLIKDFYKTEDSLRFEYNRIQVHHERLYDTSGQEIVHREYHRLGYKTSEEIFEYLRNLKITLNYNPDGTLKSVWHATIYYKKDPQQTLWVF
jgi:antitoxin component YwqK of YwqJK toxin-antitoxin module